MSKKGKSKSKKSIARDRSNSRTGKATSNVDAKIKSGDGNYAVNLPEGIDRIKVKEGKGKYDFVSYEITRENHPDGLDVGDFGIDRQYGIHFGFGDENKTPVICRKETWGEPCPVCEFLAKGKKEGTLTDEEIKMYKLKKKSLFIHLNDDYEPEILDVSYFLFTKLLYKEIQASDNEDVRFFADLEGGYTVSVRWEEEKLPGSNPFLKAGRVDFLEREDIPEECDEDIPSLDDMLDYPTYEAVAAMLHGSTEEDEDEDDEVEEKPKKSKGRKSKGKGKKKPEPEEDDDEEEEDAEDSDDEPEEKPKKKKGKGKGKKGKAKKEAPEEGDDDEEEEEAPKKKSKSKASKKSKSKKGKSKKKEEPEEELADDELEEGECLIADGEFGDDYDMYRECGDCPNAESCEEASEE